MEKKERNSNRLSEIKLISNFGPLWPGAHTSYLFKHTYCRLVNPPQTDTVQDQQTLPAGCLWDSTPLRCRCWEGRCRLRWTWWDGWTERLSSENNRTNTLQPWVPNIKLPKPPWKQRTRERTDGSFICKAWRITLPEVHQNSLFVVGSLARHLRFLRVEVHSCSGHLVETCA